MQASLSIRVDAANPDHHLWKNGGTWWIHYTIHTRDGRKRRVRTSLGTRVLDRARVLRDTVFAAWSDERELGAATPPEEGSAAPGPWIRSRHTGSGSLDGDPPP